MTLNENEDMSGQASEKKLSIQRSLGDLKPEISDAPEIHLAIHNLDQFPRRKLVGRVAEVKRLNNFLIPINKGEDSLSIMIVIGPQGIGKSTLVRNAAWTAVESNKFRSVLWFSREKFTSFLIGDPGGLPIPDVPIVSDPIWSNYGKFVDAESFEYVRYIHQKNAFRNEKERKDTFTFFRGFLATHSPFLIVVDDFDEKDNLNSLELCKELERVHTPNKIILTSRLLDHAFSDGVYEMLEVGLLGADEVNALVENDFQNVPLHQFPENSIYLASQLAWEWSAGLPTFITKCLTPKLQKTGWKFNKSKRWNQICRDFAEEYIQIDFRGLSNDEKYILASLVTQEHLQNLEDKDLALSLGFCPEDIDELEKFYEILRTLQRGGLIGIRTEHGPKDKSQLDIAWHKWTLLPFTKDYILENLSAYLKGDFTVQQIDRWSHFLEVYKNTPQIVEPYLNMLMSVFLLRFENEDWNRVINFGNLLSTSMWDLNYQNDQDPQKRFQFELLSTRLVNGCQNHMNWWEIIQHLTKLTHYYLNAKEIGKASLTCERAVKLLSQAESNGKVRDEHWAAASHIYAKVQSFKGNSEVAVVWFERAEHAYIIQGDLEGAAQSGIDISREYIRLKQFESSVATANRSKNNALLINDKKLVITANMIMAEIALSRGSYERHMELTQESINIAREEKLFTIENNLKERLRTCQQEIASESVSPLLYMVDLLVSPRVEWGGPSNTTAIQNCPIHGAIDSNLSSCPYCAKQTDNCPVCRNSIEISSIDVAKCQVCSTHFHLQCLSLIGNKCSICQKNSFFIGI